MTHLICTNHDRRVVVLDNGNVYHRTGDGSKCPDTFVDRRGETITPQTLLVKKEFLKAKSTVMTVEEAFRKLGYSARQAMVRTKSFLDHLLDPEKNEDGGYPGYTKVVPPADWNRSIFDDFTAEELENSIVDCDCFFQGTVFFVADECTHHRYLVD